MDDVAKEMWARNTDAVIHQSVIGERVAVALEALNARMALPSPAPALSKGSLALVLLLVSVAALVGSCVGTAWAL